MISDITFDQHYRYIQRRQLQHSLGGQVTVIGDNHPTNVMNQPIKISIFALLSHAARTWNNSSGVTPDENC